MARTDSLTLVAYKLLSGHGHHHHRKHHGKGIVQSGGTQDFHLGSFHHHVTGTQIGYGLGVIILLVVVAVVAAWLRSIFA